MTNPNEKTHTAMQGTVFDPPKYITSSIEQADQNSFDAILPKNEVEIQLNEISDKLFHPVTLIEFKDNICRVDSSRSRILFQYCCETLRVCAGTTICTTCDRNYAQLFQGIDLSKEKMSDVVNSRIDDRQYEDNLYQNGNYGKPEFVPVETRDNYGYLEYNCPIMGLRELHFPIIVCNKVLGVFFVGQMLVEEIDTDENIKEIRKSFLKNHPNIFDDYIQYFSGQYTEDDIIESILRLDDPRQREMKYQQRLDFRIDKGLLSKYKPAKITKSDYDERVKKALEEIAKFEQFLNEKFYNNLARYIKLRFSDVIDNNYAELQKELPVDSLNMKDHWDSVKTTIRPILRELGISSLSIFARDDNTQVANKKQMDLVAYVSTHTASNKSVEKWNDADLKFDDSNLKNIAYGQIMSTISSRNIDLFGCIRYLDSVVPFTKNREIFYYPVKANSNAAVAVCIRFDQDNESEHNHKVKKLIWDEIPSLVRSISMTRTFFQSEVDRRNTEKTLRIYRHEISHLTLGLYNHNKKLAPPYFSIRHLTDDQLEAVYNDNDSSLEQLSYFTQNTGMLVGAFTRENLKRTQFKVFKELLFKWEKMYEREARDEHLAFHFPSSLSESDADRPLIYNDKQRLEQLIYNLVNNAVKYSHWGTNIYIDCKMIDRSSSKQCLTVMDFGHPIAEGDAPYGLYYRDKSPHIKKTEGCGIGLYMAREVAKLIGVEVRHKPSQLISRYNIPLMQYYILTV